MNIDLTGEFWMYLRKSRADLEAEQRGEGETFTRHKRALHKLGKDMNINITEIYEEIVSGESLFHRPEMLKVLERIEERPPRGVLVMDMDRLGRGNMQEQGLILDTFRRGNVLIVSPNKTYDLSNESDELMTEVQALFARQELKVITRRMQRGRVASVEEGNYIGTRPPYGYKIFKEGRDRFLIPHPDQSPIVKKIFEWYINEQIGTNKIANRLNEMGLRSYTGKTWIPSSILIILKNEVYTGLVQWKKKEQTKSKEPGKRRDTRTRDRSEWISVKGKHEPLISEDTFKKAQERLKTKYHVPYQLTNGITNPLAGLIKCAKCGYSMIHRPYANQAGHIMCINKECDNRSSRMEYVEDKILVALDLWLQDYTIQFNKTKRQSKAPSLEVHQNVMISLEKEMKELEQQKGRLHDFLERGVYTEEIFLERSKTLQDRIDQNIAASKQAKQEMENEQKRQVAKTSVIPELKKTIKMYRKTKDPAKKNALLKSILLHAIYKKEKHQRNDNFDLKLLLLIDR